ncbi:MAG: DUF3365 domain-containing protein [Aquificae bacterium]|nr:DUF3365 domain-containing protein [Aquificota bacterium]
MYKLLYLPILSVLVFSCTKKDDVPISLIEEMKVREVGEKYALELLRTLKQNLMKAMNNGGPYNAVEFCSTKAQYLTKLVEQKIDHGVKLKRTSFKYRNPLNKPDKYEAEALKIFEKYYKEYGQLRPYYIQKVREQDGQYYYRYYKPLVVKPLCLICHGDPEKMDPQLYQKIKEKYPEDKAIGYKEGDFRGVVRVSIPVKVINRL